jgi:hypothetical protein
MFEVGFKILTFLEVELGSILIAGDSKWQTSLEFGANLVGRTQDIDCCLQNDHFYFLLAIDCLLVFEKHSFGYKSFRGHLFLVDSSKVPVIDLGLLVLCLANCPVDVKDPQQYTVVAKAHFVGGDGALVAHRHQPHSGPRGQLVKDADSVLLQHPLLGSRHHGHALEESLI